MKDLIKAWKKFAWYLALSILSTKTILAQQNSAATDAKTWVYPQTDSAKEPLKHLLRYTVASAATLAFSGLNTNITGEVGYGRHSAYLGPKISVADAYLPSTAPLGFVAGYKVFINKAHSQKHGFDFFVVLDYQFQNHKAFRSNQNLPLRYNSLHELNAGYGLQYNISGKLAINNVLGFGRYLEIFRNPKSGTETKFDGYNRMLRVQLLYRLR